MVLHISVSNKFEVATRKKLEKMFAHVERQQDLHVSTAKKFEYIWIQLDVENVLSEMKKSKMTLTRLIATKILSLFTVTGSIWRQVFAFWIFLKLTEKRNVPIYLRYKVQTMKRQF